MLVVWSWFAASGCVQYVYSPPARGLPLETVRPLAPDQQSVGLEGGGAFTLFAPEFAAGSLRYRRGIAEDYEGSVEATVLHDLDADAEPHTHPNAYALRLALKARVSPTLALTAGLGGGGSALGGFASPDAGVIVANENRYAVPFFGVRGFVSVPLAPRTVELGPPPFYLGTDRPEVLHGRPRFTYGFAANVGVRVPFEETDELSHGFYLGLAATYLRDTRAWLLLFGPCGGVEFVF